MSICPNKNDVLLGRGGHNYANKGNQNLKDMALHRAREYGAASKKEKAEISRQILKQVRDKGGRFLEKVDKVADIWMEVDDVKAREKVCQVLRDHFAAIKDQSSSSDGTETDEDEGESAIEDQPGKQLLHPMLDQMREASETNSANFDFSSDYNAGSFCSDFDLFEGQLLTASAHDDIFCYLISD